MVIRFDGYTDEDLKQAKLEEAYHDATLFTWLHVAYFWRDPRGHPLVPLDYDKIDTAVEVTKAFKACRVPDQTDDDGAPRSFKLNPDGADFVTSKAGLELLEKHVKLFVTQELGSGDVLLVAAVQAWFKRAYAMVAKKDADEADAVASIDKGRDRKRA